MTDLISRTGAIDELRHLIPYKKYHRGKWVYLLDRREVFKALNALPSADAVSREKCDKCKTDKEGVLLQQLAELHGDYETIKNAYEYALADAAQEWIQCSERLPKENEYVGNVCKYYLIQDEYGDMHVAHLSGRGWETIESVKALGCDVLAWMPLPKPYREDGEV